MKRQHPSTGPETYTKDKMFSFTESVTITASPSVIWTHLIDLKCWWGASNLTNHCLEIDSPDKSIAMGTGIRFERQICGIRIEAEGKIVSLQKRTEMTWEGIGRYQYRGICVSLSEGMKWRIAPMNGVALVSVSAWAEFPLSVKGRLLKWYSVKHLHIVEAARSQARTDLNFLKQHAEAPRGVKVQDVLS